MLRSDWGLSRSKRSRCVTHQVELGSDEAVHKARTLALRFFAGT
jgi:hypothetical protein